MLVDRNIRDVSCKLSLKKFRGATVLKVPGLHALRFRVPNSAVSCSPHLPPKVTCMCPRQG